MDNVHIKNNLQVMYSAENNTCQSEEASELGYIRLLYCLSSHKYSSMTLYVDSLFSLVSSYGDLELQA